MRLPIAMSLIALVVAASGSAAIEPALKVNANGMTLAAVSETEEATPKNDEELVKQLANPVSSLISVPFQNNFDFNLGPNDDGFKYTLNFQPVIPVSLNRDWNVIIRTIVPFVYQNDVIPGTTQDGMSDITQSFFFSPSKPVSGLIIGVGPVFLYPTATDDLLGSEKWGAGPTVVIAKQSGGLTYGLLANQIWSFAGEGGRNYVSSTFLQPFISYATKTKTTFGINAESSYDWHNQQWTVPINLSISQLTKVGGLPVQFAIGGKIYAEGPNGAPDWGLRFTVTPLFPTGGKR
jgi:hypothetical protein